MKVGVMDYGVGNLGSVMRALEELRVTPLLIERAIDIHQVDSLILPGVGGFAECKSILDSGGWTERIRDEVLSYDKPLLGICLGMQLLADYGEEGSSANMPIQGLGLIPGRVVSLKSLGCNTRIPHVGWNSVTISRQHYLFNGIPNGTDFYFVHSYAFVPDEEADVIATVDYEININVSLQHKKVMGTQFHPEKSSRAGFRLLRNFIGGSQC